jgi:serine/threonine-protein kinase
VSDELKPPEPQADLQLEIAHLLLIDVVGYSKQLVNEQVEWMQELNRIVRNTRSFQTAEKSGKLIRVPTGDGMALLFFRSPEEPARCAMEIGQALKSHRDIQLRMGIHSGPVNEVRDVNDQLNIAGAGINIAQRVMDCGDAGHILLSKHVSDDLAQYRHWQPFLHELGECEVKHGLKLHIVNLCKEGVGNPQPPQKLRRRTKWDEALGPLTASRWAKVALVFVLLLSAIALAVSFFTSLHRASPEARVLSEVTAPIQKKTIAILPFQSFSDDKQNASLSDGVQDEILTDLAKVADLKVISRTSVMQYKNPAQRNLREIARQLGVAHIVEGSVQCSGNRVRVSAQLIDASTDAHLWAEHYDRDIADVFALESEVAEQIVAKLKAKLSPEEKTAIEEEPTRDLGAYDLYARAKALDAAINFDARANKNLPEAARLLKEAVVRDPNFFLAHCLLGRVHDEIYFIGIDRTPARLALADAAVKAAVLLRPNAGETHLASAQHLYWGYRDYERARQELAAARRVLPNEPLVFELSGYIDRRQGRWDEAMRELEHTLVLDPLNVSSLQQVSFTYQRLRRFADAAVTLERALKVAPKDVGTRVYRSAMDLWWHADPKPLHATFQTILREEPHALATVADQLIHLGLCERDAAEARQGLASLSADGYYDQSFPYPYAWVEGWIARLRGDNDAAQAAFTRARADVDKMVGQQPAYAEAVCVLGMIDAALGNKAQAIREGQRALELLPLSTDSISGEILIENSALIYAWSGEKDLALAQLAKAAGIPGDLSYGYLRLHPYWDPLRGDARFEKIVASFAPKAE